jgi:hypothetical protein
MGELAAENNCQNKFTDGEKTKVSLPKKREKGNYWGGGGFKLFFW